MKPKEYKNVTALKYTNKILKQTVDTMETQIENHSNELSDCYSHYAHESAMEIIDSVYNLKRVSKDFTNYINRTPVYWQHGVGQRDDSVFHFLIIEKKILIIKEKKDINSKPDAWIINPKFQNVENKIKEIGLSENHAKQILDHIE